MNDLTGVLGVMIPLTAVVLGIGLAFWSIYWDHQKKRLQYQERQMMIEKGMIPPSVLPEERRKMTPADCLRRGTVLIFLGSGLGLAAVIVSYRGPAEELGALLGVGSAIVGSLGFGYLTYYWIARRESCELADRANTAGSA
jgi:hypothetical protein